MINQTILQGRISGDPVLTAVGVNGTYVCNIDVACNEKYKGKEDTLFMPCVFWGKTAEFLVSNFEKGQDIILQGRLFQSNRVDTNGKNRKEIKLNVTKCEFCGGKKSNSTSNNNFNDVTQHTETATPITLTDLSDVKFEEYRDFLNWLHKDIKGKCPRLEEFTQGRDIMSISITEIDLFIERKRAERLANKQVNSQVSSIEEIELIRQNRKQQNNNLQSQNSQNTLSDWFSIDEEDDDDLPDCLG